jgi:RHS repeat-associated protein
MEERTTAVVGGVTGMRTSGLVQRDAVGRVIAAYQPFFTPGASTLFLAPQPTFATTTTYDSHDRPTLITYPDLATETTTYSIAVAPGGGSALTLFRAQHIDANGHARETYTDHLDRTWRYVEHPTTSSSSITRYDYDPLGQLVGITDAEGNPTALSYDLRGLRTTLLNADTGKLVASYDLAGNKISAQDANHLQAGTEVHYHYDYNRLSEVHYNTFHVTYTYGAPGAPDHLAGRLASITRGSDEQLFGYGALGEVVTAQRYIATPDGSFKFDQRFTYDSFGRLLSLRYPDGETVKNLYDAAGNLTEVVGTGDGWSHTYAKNLRYDVFGHRTHLESGNDVVTDWTYEPQRQRLASTLTTLPTSEKIQDLHYTYDLASNPTQITNTLAPLLATSGNAPGPSTVSFTYDGVDRLLTASGDAQQDALTPSTYGLDFSYSPSHNLVTKTRTGTVAPYGLSYHYTTRPHLPSSVDGQSFAYDASGNPTVRYNATTQNTVTLTYDEDHRLVALNDATGAVKQRNGYDPSGLRIWRQEKDGSMTVYASPYFDVEGKTGIKHIFAGELRVASALGVFKSGGYQPAAPKDAPTAYYFHGNHLGSTSVTTDEDAQVHQSLEYFADGETWIDRTPQTAAAGLLFSGKPLDATTGYYDFGQRFYDPRTSLWLGVDPVLAETPGKSVGSPMVLAVGAYAAQNPLRYIDPDGRSPDTEKELIRFESPELYNRRLVEGISIDWDRAIDIAQLVVDLLPGGRGVKIVRWLGNQVVDYFQGEWDEPMDIPFHPGPRVGSGKNRDSVASRCFAAGTLIKTNRGFRPIETIEIGDLVWSRDDQTGSEEWKSEDLSHP